MNLDTGRRFQYVGDYTVPTVELRAALLSGPNFDQLYSILNERKDKLCEIFSFKQQREENENGFQLENFINDKKDMYNILYPIVNGHFLTIPNSERILCDFHMAEIHENQECLWEKLVQRRHSITIDFRLHPNDEDRASSLHSLATFLFAVNHLRFMKDFLYTSNEIFDCIKFTFLIYAIDKITNKLKWVAISFNYVLDEFEASDYMLTSNSFNLKPTKKFPNAFTLKFQSLGDAYYSEEIDNLAKRLIRLEFGEDNEKIDDVTKLPEWLCLYKKYFNHL